MDLQEISTENNCYQLKIHKLPRNWSPSNRQLQTKDKQDHIQNPTPIIDSMLSNVRLPEMDFRFDPID